MDFLYSAGAEILFEGAPVALETIYAGMAEGAPPTFRNNFV